MRLLVLGGTRFIGDRIVREALQRGDEVIVVHRGVTEPGDAPGGGNLTHLHAARTDFSAISEQVRALRPDAVVDTNAMTRADADRYPLRGIIDGRDDYEKLDVEPGYLDRGGTVLRLAAIYGERDPQRREEFILRRVRAGRTRIPVGAGTWLWTRGYVGDVASAVLAVLDNPATTAGEIFNVGDLATDTVRDYANRILAAAGHDAELVTVPDSVLPADLEITKATSQHFLGDCGKLTRSMDWCPGDAGDGIIRSVEWHLNNPPDAAPGDFAADDRALLARGDDPPDPRCAPGKGRDIGRAPAR